MSLFGDDEEKYSNFNRKEEKKNDIIEKQNNKQNKKINLTKTKTKIVKEEEIIDKNRNLVQLKEIKSFEKIKQSIIKQFTENKLHHCLMFSGNYGIGKTTFAYWLVYLLIIKSLEKQCEISGDVGENELQELKEMHIDMLKGHEHPDVYFLSLQEGENEIKIEKVRKLLDNWLQLKPSYFNKFVIIDDINSINTNGVNALLKSLEEPPNSTYFILINHKNTNILDTIYSRCIEMNFSINKNDCLRILKELHEDWTIDELSFYCEISENSVSIAEILFNLNIQKSCQQIIENDFNYNFICSILNNIYKELEKNYKNATRSIKILILEKIIFFIIKVNTLKAIKNNYNDNNLLKTYNAIISNLVKQFIDIKTFELPVNFC